ncbi:hypothetical protein BKA93DRAFT_602004 [Sparassis latifolia]|uniref:Dynactin subunit n=1 Tax=Sparassis crispa TaxID=139825 RepID=A0A401GGP9_9APHY|nr:predicted protein [Sparassis crispa]GBE81374.1 predicted protein [Sparassis crispa]
MSANKYANLPDIDTAPDVYETEDVFPSSNDNKGDSSDDELNVAARSHGRGKNAEASGREEIDSNNLMEMEEASRKFRKAERKQHRPRILYAYPPSPTSPTSASETPAIPLSQRLRVIEAMLAEVETELADPSNPLLKQEKDVEPGDLNRRMVDAKGRLEKISKLKEGRGKLVSVVLGEEEKKDKDEADKEKERRSKPDSDDGVMVEVEEKGKTPDIKDISEMDRRVGELEKTMGSSTASLDELSPLPLPLLPLLTRLNSLLTLLTQPRHVDAIARRIKLLLSDFDRLSSISAQQHGGQRRQSSHPHVGAASSPHPNTAPAPTVPAPSPLPDQLTPILTRLAPLLPHIPHVLTRLRTLSALHTSAASFQSTLEGLEEEQRRKHSALEELERAVQGVETSMKDNESMVKTNVNEIEERVESVGRRIEELHVSS